MKVSHAEGLATHSGPESCVGAGDCAGEALTGEGAGWVSSREIHAPLREQWVLRGADAVEEGGRQDRARRHREVRQDPARSQTPCMHGSTSHGNREIPRLSAAIGVAERIGNPKGSRR
jgi:RNA-directed DNA polymerase